MKKIILLIVLVAGFAIKGYAQEKPDGFWGIKFGSSVEEAKKIMSTKNNCKLSDSSEEELLYSGGSFSGLDIDWLYLQFIDGRFYNSIIRLKPSSESIVFLEYEDFKEKFNAKYFKTELHREAFDSPYYNGDGYELQAIRKKKAHFMSVWNFKEDSSITLVIGDDTLIYVLYTDTKLNAIAEARKKAVESNDL